MRSPHFNLHNGMVAVLFSITSLWTRFRRKEFLKALDAYHLDPGPAQSLRLCRALTRLGHLKEALDTAVRASRKHAGHPELIQARERARSRHLRGLLVEARREYRRDRSPENACRVAEILRRMGSIDRGIRSLAKAMRAWPDDGRLHLTAGKLYFFRAGESRSEKDTARSVIHLIRAAELREEDGTTRLFLALALTRACRYEEAAAVLEALLGVDPENERALQLRQQLSRLRARKTRIEAVPAKARPPAPSAERRDESLLSIPGAQAVFVLDSRGNPVRSQVNGDTAFDFTQAERALRSMATVCHADATRIGIGSLQSCILSGPEWRICLVAGTDNDVVGFFDASVPEDALEGELSGMMASVQA